MTEDTRDLAVPAQKICKGCRKPKDRSEFYRSDKSPGGLRANCKTCVSERGKVLYAENTDAKLAANKQYRKDHPEKFRAYTRKSVSRYAPGGYAHRMSHEEWDRRWQEQDGKCYLCGIDLDSAARICIDHDHRCCGPGRSCARCRRGLACVNCNSIAGLAGENPDVLRRIAEALEFAQAAVDARAQDQGDALDDRAPVTVNWDHLYGQLALFPVVRGKISSYARPGYTPEEKALADLESCRRYRERERDKKKVAGEYVLPNSDKTCCPAGHPYDEKNTHYDEDGNRKCRTCRRDRERERYASEHRELSEVGALKSLTFQVWPRTACGRPARPPATGRAGPTRR